MRSFQYQLCTAILSVTTTCGCVWAADYPSEQAYFQEFPIVLSASRLSQPMSETPNAVTVIDRAMIHASGFRTIADLFKLVPGMYVDYQDGYTPIVSYHGATDIYTRRMQVLVDGRSVYLQPYNTVDWADLPLHIDDIERIEVVRGPAATSYGSNSTLGVINITTRDASALSGATLSVTRGNAGNAGISDAAAHFGSNGEQWDYRLTLGRRADNGFNFPMNVCTGAQARCQPTYYSIYDDSNVTWLASLRSNYHPNGADSFDFQMGFSNGVRVTGYPGLPVRPDEPLRNLKNDSGYQQLTWLRTLDHGDDVQLRYYHISRSTINERTTGALYGAPPPGIYFLADNIVTHRHELELQHTMHINPDNRMVWGGAMRHETVDAPSLFLTPQSLPQSRLFAHDEWRMLPPLVLNAGAMLEDNGMGDRKISPRAALNYHITPEHTLRTSISVAYRNPALMEERSNSRYILPGWGLYQMWFSYGGLRPERALSREIGYIGKLANRLSVDVRVYNDQVSDIILYENIPFSGSLKDPSMGFSNMFSARYTGLEGTAKYSWEEGRSSLAFSYSRQKVSCEYFGSPYLAASLPALLALAQGYSNTVPLNSGSLLYAGQIGERLSFSVGYYQQGSVMVLDADPHIGPQPLMRRTDMRIAKQFGPAGNKKVGGGEVALVVQNVSQDNNVGYSGYLFDRRAYLAATFNF